MNTQKMNTPTNTPVTMYFGDGVSNVTRPDTTTGKETTDYIILQNDFFHRRIEEMQKKITKLEHENEELENDNGSLETSKTSLKGYIHNMGAFNQYSRDLVNIYHQAILRVPKTNQTLEWDLKRFGGAYVVFVLGIAIMQFFRASTWLRAFAGIGYLIILLGPICLIGYQIWLHYRDVVSIKEITKNVDVIRLRGELKKAKQGNDFLSDLVDNL